LSYFASGCNNVHTDPTGAAGAAGAGATIAGVLAPLAAVFGGSEIAHRGLGTERIFSERHRETIGV
jgi:hypothetical protein